MADTLTIILANLPEEGKSYTGELDSHVLSTSESDVVKPHSSFYYDLHVQRFDNELLVRGLLEATMKMTCVRSNHEFLQTFTIEDFATAVEITSGTIDLLDALREELFIELPTDPICDNGDEKSTCEINSRYLAVDKPLNDDVNDSSEPKKAGDWSNNWNALEGLKDFSETKDKPNN